MRHEGVVAVDHDPRPFGPAERSKLIDAVEDAPAAEQHLADEDQVVTRRPCAAARKRSEKVSNGSTAIRSTTAAPASSQRANWRRALWNSPSLVSTRIGQVCAERR